MPRGYLKNKQGESLRRRRGGGSHRSGKPVNKHSKSRRSYWDDYTKVEACDIVAEDISQELLSNDDDCEDHAANNTETKRFNKKKVGNKKRNSAWPIRDCPICFESRPVFQLLKICSWHDDACFECMRQVYVTQAQKAARNYPIRCFHPQCRKLIRETQLLKYNLIQSALELDRHFRLAELAKGQQSGFCAVHCPYCDHPRAYKQASSSSLDEHNSLDISRNRQGPKIRNRAFTCRKCHQNFMISPFAEIVRAIEHDNSVEWAQCPVCSMLITRDNHYGDEEAACYCGAIFSWSEAQRKSGYRYPFGRPSSLDPYDILYLHW